MAEGFHLPNWSARNPLGIIALFISLIYGMSALLLGTSVTNLTECNQTILVGFIVLFPFVVLAVFCWLVAKHHRKLYGPGDFRSDHGFLDATDSLPPSEIANRLRNEIEGSTKSDQTEETDIAEKSAAREDSTPPTTSIWTSSIDRDKVLSLAYLAEGLVFQDLQREFGAPIRRSVRWQAPAGHRSFEIDGVIETPSADYLVETKIIRSLGLLIPKIRESARYLDMILTSMGGSNSKALLGIVAIIVAEHYLPNRISELQTKAKAGLPSNISIRIFSLEDLKRKYGFIDNS